jgi:hypothetical protein
VGHEGRRRWRPRRFGDVLFIGGGHADHRAGAAQAQHGSDAWSIGTYLFHPRGPLRVALTQQRLKLQDLRQRSRNVIAARQPIRTTHRGSRDPALQLFQRSVLKDRLIQMFRPENTPQLDGALTERQKNFELQPTARAANRGTPL